MARKIPAGMDNALPNITSEELSASRDAAKAMPTWKGIEQAFGEQAVKDKKINLDVETREGRANRGKLLDMMMPAWAKEATRGQLFGSKMERTYMRDSEGRTKVAPIEMADRIARENGLHAITNWGRRRKRLMTITANGELLRHG